MRRVPAQLLLTVACLVLLGYFTYHGVYGKHGYEASHQINAEVAELRETLDRLTRDKAALDHRITLMLPESLDPDMLDESARSALSFALPTDLIILHSQE